MHGSLSLRLGLTAAVATAGLAAGAALVATHAGSHQAGGASRSVAAVQSAREASVTVRGGAGGDLGEGGAGNLSPAVTTTPPTAAAPSGAPGALPTPRPPLRLYLARTGPWSGIALRHMANVSVESLPGAWLLGQVTFTTNDPYYSCLSGHRLDAWSVPAYPGLILVHNGDQGPQCTYGTWSYAPFYSGTWHGARTSLSWRPNLTVEALPDARLVGQLANFQTDNPYDVALDGVTRQSGDTINVWQAAAEFPGRLVAHNGDQGPQPVYITLLLP